MPNWRSWLSFYWPDIWAVAQAAIRWHAWRAFPFRWSAGTVLLLVTALLSLIPLNKDQKVELLFTDEPTQKNIDILMAQLKIIRDIAPIDTPASVRYFEGPPPKINPRSLDKPDDDSATTA